MIYRRELREMLTAMYPVAALLIIAPAVDLVATTWPVRAGTAGWRFGSIGIGFGFIIIEILGLALAMAIAAFLEHRRTLRALSGIAIGAAVVTVAGIAQFLTDYSALRHVIASAEMAPFDSSTLRALLLACLAVPVLMALGARGWNASARPDPDRSVEARPDYVIPLRFRDQV